MCVFQEYVKSSMSKRLELFFLENFLKTWNTKKEGHATFT